MFSCCFGLDSLFGQNWDATRTQAMVRLSTATSTHAWSDLDVTMEPQTLTNIIFFSLAMALQEQQLRLEFYDKGHDLEQEITRSDLRFFFGVKQGTNGQIWTRLQQQNNDQKIFFLRQLQRIQRKLMINTNKQWI